MEKIKNLIRRICTLLITLPLLTACAPLGRLPLDMTQRQTIHQTNQIVSTNQKNLEVEPVDPPSNAYTPSYGIGGALAVAIMGKIENYNANQLLIPINQHLIDNHFNQQLSQQLAQELKTIKWLHFNDSELRPELSLARKNMLINTSPGDAMVYVALSYQLAQLTLDALIVTAEVEIHKKSQRKPILIYQNKFQYIEQIKPQKSAKEATRIWAEHHAAKIRQAMQTAIRLLAHAIAQDIQNNKSNAKMNYTPNIEYVDVNKTQTPASGHLENKIGDKTFIRNREGELIIVNDQLVKKKT